MAALGRVASILGMFAAIAGSAMGGMRDWSDHLTPEERQALIENQKKHYKLLLERRGVREFYSRDLNVTVMARNERNAERKFNNIRRALKDQNII